MHPSDALGSFMIAIACGIVLGVAVLLIIYRMVDGHLPIGAGLFSLVSIMLIMALAIRSPYEAVPAVVLIVALTLMAFFPFAERILEEFELRGIDAKRMERTYAIVQEKPDNFVARFELARLIHSQGFPAHAIHLASSTFETLKTERDDVHNRSIRDMFTRDESTLKRWKAESPPDKATKCPSCGAYNHTTAIFCTGCNRPYLADIVMSTQVRPRVWARLVLAWSCIAIFIPGAVSIGLSFRGSVRIAVFVGAFALIGALMYWLFRPPKGDPMYYG